MNADGEWNVKVRTPRGPQEGILHLKTDGRKLTGTFSGTHGTAEVTDGIVDGDKLSWKTRVRRPMPINVTFSATVEGDRMSGTINLGILGKATMEATRA